MTKRLCSGFSCSVAFSPWMRIPSARRGIWRRDTFYFHLVCLEVTDDDGGVGGVVTCRAMSCFRKSMCSWSSGCSWM